MDWKQILISTLTPMIPWIVGLLAVNALPLIPGITGHAFEWLKSKTGSMKNEYARGVMNRLITLAGQKVLALEQTEIEFLKERLANGTITKDQLPALLAEVKARAIAAVKADASAQGLLKEALTIFVNEGALHTWLDHVVESICAQLPPSGLQTAAPTTMPAASTPEVPVAPPVPQQAAS